MPGPPNAPTTGKAAAWLRTHRKEALAGGGGAVALFALYKHHSATTAAASSAGKTTPVATTAPARYSNSGFARSARLTNEITRLRARNTKLRSTRHGG